MARKKRTSKSLERAELRAAGLISIDPELDFGNGHTLPNFKGQATAFRAKLESYNTLLSQLDGLSDEIDNDEKALSHENEAMLLGAALKFGKDSPEYEQAGGVRRSERRRQTRKVGSSAPPP